MKLTVIEAQRRWLEIIERVRSGEEVEISEDGVVIGLLIRPNPFRTRVRTATIIAAEDTLSVLNALRSEPTKQSVQGISPERAESLTRALREERDNDWSS
jgi:antitoxin (DNA-binding transcriptional repressor) of toxin-antitoxin stability system